MPAQIPNALQNVPPNVPRAGTHPSPGLSVLLCIVLAALTAAYLSKGFYFLLKADTGAGDLHQRWVVQQYVNAHLNPWDVLEADLNHQPISNPRALELAQSVGPIQPVTYPPWSLPFTALFLWPPWPQVRYGFAALNLVALAVLLEWGAFVGRAHGGKLPACVAALSCTAIGANATTLGLGQYGLIVTAALVLAARMSDAHPLAAGSALAVSWLKPNVAGLFPLPLAVRYRWLPLAAMATCLIAGTCWTWIQIDANPILTFRQWMHAVSLQCPFQRLTVPGALVSIGVPAAGASALAAAIAFPIALVLVAIWRHAPLLCQFAIAAVVGRFWSYHPDYDNISLVFLLIALCDHALRTPTPMALCAFLLTGVTLWAPAKIVALAPFQAFQMLSWIAGLSYLLKVTPRHFQPPAPTIASP